MNELQKIQFDMLQWFVKICNKLNLTYYLVCGSALGAEKYQGFIPWDDDLDVALPRKDYEVFCKNAQLFLPDYMFLQNHHTEKEYPLMFSKLRNSNTTYVEIGTSGLNINHGIYIDIFPLDGYPENIELQIKLEKEKKKYQLAYLSCLKTKQSWKVNILLFFERLLGVNKRINKYAENFEKHISLYSVENSKLMCNHGNWQGTLEYAPKSQYGKGKTGVFEGLTVSLPENTNEYLTQKYGNWKEDLPKEQQIGHHYYYICDTKRSYKDYILKSSKHKVTFKTNCSDF